jgi:D-alanine-D-alanine ligase
VPYFLDANPNPDISDGEELASAAALIGMTYGDLISRIVSLGLRRGATGG